MASLLVTTPSFGQFQRSYGLPEMERAHSLTTLSEEHSRYLIAGFTSYPFFSGHDATLIKTNPLGGQVWTAIYGGVRPDYFNSVRQSAFTTTNPSSYIMAGATQSFGFGEEDAWLVGTNSDGTPVFSRVFGRRGTDIFYDVKNCIVSPTGQNGYVAVGTSDSYEVFGQRDVFVVKTNVVGSLIAATVIGVDGDQEGFWIEQTRDGGFILVGYSHNSECLSEPTLSPPKDIFVVKLRQDLSISWSRTLGLKESPVVSSFESVARAVKEAPNGEFYITGYTNAFGSNHTYDPFLLVLGRDGAFQTFNTYGTARENEYGFSLELGVDATGNVRTTTILGGNNSLDRQNMNAMMFQLDPALELNWAREYGRTRDDMGFELTSNGPDGFAFTGFTASLGAGQEDSYLVVTNPDGTTGTVCERRIELKRERHLPCIVKSAKQIFVEDSERIQPEFERLTFREDRCSDVTGGDPDIELGQKVDIMMLPNPTSASLAIRTTGQTNVVKVDVFDAKGQLFETPATKTDADNFQLDTSSLKKGIYIVQVHLNDGHTIQRKFIKE
ncbi:MAG: T9SS type A sorting domain-containing protein [Bacteroidota bacterium]